MNNLDQNGFAIKDTRVKVHNYSRENNELTSSTYEHVVEGSGIPALSTRIEPNADKNGFTQVFNAEQQAWEYVEDHRYESDVYNIHTKQKEEIRYIGTLKDEHTTVAPPSHDHEFINGEWIITEEKQAEIDAMQKQQRINELESEKADLKAKMQMHDLLEEKEEAKVAAQRLKEVEAELGSLKA